MSEQARLWSRYHAAALQTNEPEMAARKADKALAEYNKRFETLSKLEHECARLDNTLQVRDEQIYELIMTLIEARDLFENLREREPELYKKIDQMSPYMNGVLGRAKQLHQYRGRWVYVPRHMAGPDHSAWNEDVLAKVGTYR